MKLRLCLFALGLLLVSAATVRADGIPPGDPDIIVGEGTGSGPVNSLPFSFIVPTDTTACTVNTFTGQCFNGFNNTGGTIASFVITLLTAPSGALSCGQGPTAVFTSCVVNGLSVTFSGGTGILNTTHFFIFLQDGITGTVTVSNVPEPATLGLLVTGLGALYAGRKLRKRAASRT